MTVLYVFIAILLFGLLIFVHELGHYTFARIFHVTIEEFAIGMGPKLFSRVSKKTNIRYSLRLFPIGGYVSMPGEDEESDDPNSFYNKPVYQKIIITVAGGLTNIIVGFLVMFFIVAFSAQLFAPKVSNFAEWSTSNVYGLKENDVIVRFADENVHTAYELAYAIQWKANEPVDIIVERDGERVVLEDVEFPTEDASGVKIGVRDFNFTETKKTFGLVIKDSFYRSIVSIRMVYDSLFGLITGKFKINQMSGPVGITKVMVEAAETGASSLFSIFVIIAMNLGIFNLLPIPALDGGRILIMLIECIIKRKINMKVQGVINMVVFALLILLMIYVTFKDIFSLFA